MVVRCGWAGEDPLMTACHDEEWGVPVHDDRRLFEFLVLEGAQAGLSRRTILRKRENYRRVLAGFDPAPAARHLIEQELPSFAPNPFRAQGVEARVRIPRKSLAAAAAGLALLVCPIPLAGGGRAEASQPCTPTRPDMEGPFYRPGAPERSSTGSGVAVAGRVLGAPDCRPVPGARIEWWQANRMGRYDDAHRGSQVADASGGYRFSTDFPGAYPGRPPHIHFKVFAPGFFPLTTQLYLRAGEAQVEFPIVLAPQSARPPAGAGTSP